MRLAGCFVLATVISCGSKTSLGDRTADSGATICKYAPGVVTGSQRSGYECGATAFLLACSYSANGTLTDYCPTDHPDPATCVASSTPPPSPPNAYSCVELCTSGEYALAC